VLVWGVPIPTALTLVGRELSSQGIVPSQGEQRGPDDAVNAMRGGVKTGWRQSDRLVRFGRFLYLARIVDKIARSGIITAKFKRQQSLDGALLVVPGNQVASCGNADWERAVGAEGGVAVVRVGARRWVVPLLSCSVVAWLLVEVGQPVLGHHGKGAACIPSMRLAGISKDQAWNGATKTAATYGV